MSRIDGNKENIILTGAKVKDVKNSSPKQRTSDVKHEAPKPISGRSAVKTVYSTESNRVVDQLSLNFGLKQDVHYSRALLDNFMKANPQMDKREIATNFLKELSKKRSHDNTYSRLMNKFSSSRGELISKIALQAKSMDHLDRAVNIFTAIMPQIPGISVDISEEQIINTILEAIEGDSGTSNKKIADILVTGADMLKNEPEAKRFKAITEFLFVKKGLDPKKHFDTSTVHRLASQSKDVKSAIKLTKSFFNKVLHFMNKGVKPNFRFILDVLEQNPKVSSRHVFKLHNQFGNQLEALRKQFPKAEFSNERKTKLLQILVNANTLFNSRATKAVKKNPLFKALMKENKNNKFIEDHFEAFKDIKTQQDKATNLNKVLDEVIVEETIHFNEELGLNYVIEDGFAEYFLTFDTEESVWLMQMEDGNFWYEYGDAYYIYDVKTGESSLYEAEAVVEDISTESTEAVVERTGEKEVEVTDNKDIPLPPPPPQGKPLVLQELSVREKKERTSLFEEINALKGNKGLKKVETEDTKPEEVEEKTGGFNTDLLAKVLLAQGDEDGENSKVEDEDDEWK